MTPRPVSLNKAVALLFITGSALFALGSVPAYLNAVGETADSVTYFVGSIFFTSASFAQLLQAQTPAMTEVDAESQHTRTPVRFQAWLPHDRNWLVSGYVRIHHGASHRRRRQTGSRLSTRRSLPVRSRRIDRLPT